MQATRALPTSLPATSCAAGHGCKCGQGGGEGSTQLSTALPLFVIPRISGLSLKINEQSHLRKAPKKLDEDMLWCLLVTEEGALEEGSKPPLWLGHRALSLPPSEARLPTGSGQGKDGTLLSALPCIGPGDGSADTLGQWATLSQHHTSAEWQSCHQGQK